MKAIVYDHYGPPTNLYLEDIPKPIPTNDQILIKVLAVSLNGSDREGLRGHPLYVRLNGFRKPNKRILGSDIAGIVEEVGPHHTEFKVGDHVFGEIPGYHDGLAEYVCTHGKTLLNKPNNLTFAEAAAIPQAGVIALRSLQTEGQIKAGQQVLINGAGGSAGTFAIQLAKALGAEVTGVDQAEKLPFVRMLGADHVLDYQKHDFTRQDLQYDLILDVVAQRSVFAYRRALKPAGKAFVVGGHVSTMIQILLLGPILKKRTNQDIRVLAVPQSRKELETVLALCQTGQIKPIIARQYPLIDTPQAFHDLDTGHAQGKIVIMLEGH
jgi:NADPH:quinone reductase-like Zn-dependent oxidoreductase